jgi:site-specific DNA-methyltransferase (adenine-specific)
MRHELCQGDCELWLHQLRDEPITCIFADPRDNIGLRYGECNDKIPTHEYLTKLETWLELFLHKAPTVWFSFNARWTVAMGDICARLQAKYASETKLSFKIKTCVQTFTFGQHSHTDLGNNHRPLWRFQRANAHLYPDDIRVESERQRMGDKRADLRGRVPGDVFDFSRVVGNSKQRRSWHPTQLNEDLVERCIRFTTQPGEWVVDPFGGTGTTLRVCRKIGRPCTLIELDPTYCERIAEEHKMELRAKGKLSHWILEETK